MKTAIYMGGLIASIALSSAAGKAPNTSNKLDCFSGTETTNPDYQGFGGTCTLLSDGCVYLDTISIVKERGAFAGTDVLPGLPGKPIGALNKLSFTYTIEDGVVGSGSPRFSVAIDRDGNGSADGYALIEAGRCNDPLSPIGHVGMECPVIYNNRLYSDWAQFVSSNPGLRFAKDSSTFIIADQPFKGTICNIEFGRASLR